MSQKLLEWDWDYVWHALCGAAIQAATIWVLYLNGVPSVLSVGMLVCLAAFGLLREKLQHEWDELTLHQLAEAWLWPIGGVLATVGYSLACHLTPRLSCPT